MEEVWSNTEFKGTLRLKLTLGVFSWPKAYIIVTYVSQIAVCKIRIKGTGTHFYGDAGEFDGRRGLNLEIWSQWLYHGTDVQLALVVTVASMVMGIIGRLQ